MRSLILASSLLLSLALPAAASNGPYLTTVGAKGPYNVPVDGDGWSMYRIPSSIGFAVDHQVDLNLFFFRSASAMRNSLNDFDRSGTDFGAGGGVVIAPGRPDFEADETAWDTYSEKTKFTLGFGIFPDLAGGGGETSKIRSTAFPSGGLRVQQSLTFIAITTVAAFTPTEWLSLGIGLYAIYSKLSLRTTVGGDSTPLSGSPQINGVSLPGNPSYSDFLELFSSGDASDPTTYFKADPTTWQFAANFSLSLRPVDWLGIGFAYRPRAWAPLPFEDTAEVDATVTFNNALAGLSPAIRSLFLSTLPDGGTNGFVGEYDLELTRLRVPRQIRMSVAFWPLDRLLIGSEVTWIEWHRAFRKTKIVLEDGTNTDVNFVSGSSNIQSTLTSRWRNRWLYSFYVSFGITDSLTARASVSWGKFPFNVDHSDQGPNSGFVSTTVSLGVSWQLGPVGLSFLFEHAFHDSDRSNHEPDSLTAKNTYYSSKQFFFHFGATIKF